MKLAIFGATGRTGQHLVRLALEQGNQVTALARDPAKLPAHAGLTVVKGSLKEADCVSQVVAGSGAVLSALGPTSSQPVFEISQGMAQIIQAMQAHGVHRLVITAGAGVGDPDDSPGLVNHLINFLLKTTAKYVYEDMLKAVALVRQSGLDWTVVRAPMLTDDPGTGRVKVGIVGKGMGPRLSRADLADFLLQQVESPRYSQKAPAISN